jgi:hypothetical protein
MFAVRERSASTSIWVEAGAFANVGRVSAAGAVGASSWQPASATALATGSATPVYLILILHD